MYIYHDNDTMNIISNVLLSTHVDFQQNFMVSKMKFVHGTYVALMVHALWKLICRYALCTTLVAYAGLGEHLIMGNSESRSMAHRIELKYVHTYVHQ